MVPVLNCYTIRHMRITREIYKKFFSACRSVFGPYMQAGAVDVTEERAKQGIVVENDLGIHEASFLV